MVAKKTEKAKVEGMRFWTQGTRLGPANPELRRTDEPFPADGIPVSFRAPNIQYQGKPLAFIGSIVINDKDVAYKLMKFEQGVLQFDPREALDLGISEEHLAEIGIRVGPVSDEEKANLPPAEAPKEPPIPAPDFNVMRPKERQEWANAHGIFIPDDMPADKAAKFLREEMKKKTKQEQRRVKPAK
jgi:hypothetical protein